jgi:L-cysteine/cystine lyase
MLAAVDADRLRDEFPVLGWLAYLNAGTDGPVPARAVAAAHAELQREADEGRFAKHFDRRQELASAQRERYAGLLGCEAADVALTTCTSDGVAAGVTGLALGPGDEILTGEDEHPGLLGALSAARELRGVTVRTVPFERLADEVGPRTRLVACSHVSWIDGRLAPTGLADLDVPVLLDGAQGLGAIPVDVRGLGCAMYAASGQKWLCGPDGTGALYVAPEWRDRVAATRPTYGSFVDAAQGLDSPLHEDARRYDSPVLAAEALAFAGASLEVLAEAGWDNVHARGPALARELADGLRERGRTVAPRDDTTLVSWESEDPTAELARLVEAGVVVRGLPGRPLLRASAGAWNDESDIERLLGALDA